jgi:hypothetical protein
VSGSNSLVLAASCYLAAGPLSYQWLRRCSAGCTRILQIHCTVHILHRFNTDKHGQSIICSSSHLIIHHSSFIRWQMTSSINCAALYVLLRCCHAPTTPRLAFASLALRTSDHAKPSQNRNTLLTSRAAGVRAHCEHRTSGQECDKNSAKKHPALGMTRAWTCFPLLLSKGSQTTGGQLYSGQPDHGTDTDTDMDMVACLCPSSRGPYHWGMQERKLKVISTYRPRLRVLPSPLPAVFRRRLR